MDKVKLYNGYEIRSYERERDRRLAEIRKANGSALVILLPDPGGGPRQSIITSRAALTADAATREAGD
jgi:hypothetical protein